MFNNQPQRIVAVAEAAELVAIDALVLNLASIRREFFSSPATAVRHIATFVDRSRYRRNRDRAFGMSITIAVANRVRASS
jgi:hypothetical protein